MANKYKIIYADPPWKYNDRRNTHTRFCGGAMVHYDVMDYRDIARLNVDDIADDDAVLFLWATFPNLKEAIFVGESWGFKYKTVGFNWVKTNKNNGAPFFGIGYYTKSNSEVCLLFTRKKKILKPVSNSVSSIILSPREGHSKKPDIVRDKIVQLFGDIPRIELFSRHKTEGWDVFGNEVESDILLTYKD